MQLLDLPLARRLEARDRPIPPMGRAVIHDPEHPGGGAVRLLGHDVRHQTVEGADARRGGARPEELGPVDVPGGLVGAGAAAHVLVLEPDRGPRPGRLGRVAPDPGLDARLLVGGHRARLHQRIETAICDLASMMRPT